MFPNNCAHVELSDNPGPRFLIKIRIKLGVTVFVSLVISLWKQHTGLISEKSYNEQVKTL